MTPPLAVGAWRLDSRMLAAAAYGGAKDASAAWGAGGLTLEAWSTDGAPGAEERLGSAGEWENDEERLAILIYDGHLPHATAAGVAGAVHPERPSAARDT
jgi:hypothetical protein